MIIQNTLLPDWLTRCAENQPHHLALKYEQSAWSFAHLDRQVTQLARQLAMAGIQEGSRVALLAANGLSYVTCVHALTRLGAILVPLNVRLTTEELCWQVGDVRAALLVCDEGYTAQASAICAAIPSLPLATLAAESRQGETVLSELSEADVSLHTLIDLSATQAILYTSGTTGHPKGTIITYGMQWWNAIGSALNLGHRSDDCWLACLPFFHIGGLSILMRSVIYGISVVVQKKFDARAVNRSVVEDRVSIISVVAAMLQRMLTALDADGNRAHYPETLRCVLLGGGPAPQPLLEECARRALPVVQTYGLTEACSQAVTLAPEDALRKLGSAGRPLAPVQLRILRNLQPVGAHEEGEIFLCGPTITPGYAGNPEATLRAFHDGWFATGDIGYLDEEGYLYVLDRRADLIISGGENVYPAEIESVLLAHPAVAEAGVCGRDDVQWGQVPVAFVRLHPSSRVHVQDLIEYVAQRLARYKQPKTIYVVDRLPRNASGKLLRRDLPGWDRNSPPE
ncbi:MAG: o-succinylbenzoate--CoA ligase [Ktedonobacteraceae bacterium]|nr:o-succinylbenzoate--CoA ligase [Ktedonobacteraceae bacterium]